MSAKERKVWGRKKNGAREINRKVRIYWTSLVVSRIIWNSDTHTHASARAHTHTH